ncbi:CHY zinc finger [Carpediemonas membranifera]|uniref:CHY zinc finger n=1 Tax=Carpediemonas membranifera TaxID=201153 RepID=A0A8J6E2X4_9EUKA|nr:CHY zinc finger [Carpediemonas membranifera]|eukprot:KAG9395213.1 CHY zinc finger [Carpediemonas membranifera]
MDIPSLATILEEAETILTDISTQRLSEIDNDDPRWQGLSDIVESHLERIIQNLQGLTYHHFLNALQSRATAARGQPEEETGEAEAAAGSEPEEEEAVAPDVASDDEAAEPPDSDEEPPRMQPVISALRHMVTIQPSISSLEITTRVAEIFRDPELTTSARMPLVRQLLRQVQAMRADASVVTNRKVLEERSTSLRQRIKEVQSDDHMTPQDKSKLIFEMMNEHHTPQVQAQKVVATDSFVNVAILDLSDREALINRVKKYIKTELSEEVAAIFEDEVRALPDEYFGGPTEAAPHEITEMTLHRDIKPDRPTLETGHRGLTYRIRKRFYEARGMTDWAAIVDHELEHPTEFNRELLNHYSIQLFRQMKVGRVERVYGCPHYIRGCMVQCPKCKQFYACRLCHDEEHEHTLDRKAIEAVRCMKCGLVQGPSQECVGCGLVFGSYYCDECHLWESHPQKPITHCDKCTICRIGSPDQSIHCDACGMCFQQDMFPHHRCNNASLRGNSSCGVCQGDLQHGREAALPLPCGHMLHLSCYQQMINSHMYTCPLCNKLMLTGGAKDSYNDWCRRQIASQPTPVEYQSHTRKVICNECSHKWEAPLHFIGYECPECHSCNTVER